MPTNVTDKVELLKPVIGGSNSSWGNLLNEDMDRLETWLVEDRTALLAGMQSGRADEGATIKDLTRPDAEVIPLNDDILRTAELPLYYAQDVDLDPITDPALDTYKPGVHVDADWVYRQIDSLLPRGTIIAWYGTAATIPVGWALCNGQTVDTIQTPDLRGRFVMAAYDPSDLPGTIDAAFLPGNPNGAAREFNHHHLLTIADHVLTRNEIPGHTHEGSGVTGATGSILAAGTTGNNLGTTGGIWKGGGLTLGNVGANGTGGNAAPHTHTGSKVGDIDLSPGQPGVGIPWFALCYIMKVKRFAGAPP
jgi:hypothetical protein